jgi:hypothetical protein
MKIVLICLVFVWLSYICSHVRADAFNIPGSFTYYEEFVKEEVCYRNSKFLRDSSPELSPKAADSQSELTVTTCYLIGQI